VEETFLLDLFSGHLLFTSLLVLLFLLDDLDSDIFAFFPLDNVTIALFDLIAFKQELFDDLCVGEPLVSREVEFNANFGLVFALMPINSLKMLEDFLVFVCDFKAKFTVLQGFQPVILESLRF
jgi:hypothetical protein